MRILTATHSSYPRIEEGPQAPDGQALQVAQERRSRSEIDDAELEAVTRRVVQKIIQEQEEAGMDLVTDGQARGNDPISYWIKSFKGVKLGGLQRFCDTNTYLRVPCLEGSLERKDSYFKNDLEFALSVARRPVKVVLPGPVTIGLLAEEGRFPSREALIEELFGLLTDEIADLLSLKDTRPTPVIQIDEPLILKYPEFFPLLSRGLKRIHDRKGKARVLVATYFADAAPHLAKLEDLPVDGLVLDCVYGPSLLDKIGREGCSKRLHLGVVDGRSWKLEEAGDISKAVKKIASRLTTDGGLYVTTSCGLDYLPRLRARQKMQILKTIKGELSSL